MASQARIDRADLRYRLEYSMRPSSEHETADVRLLAEAVSTMMGNRAASYVARMKLHTSARRMCGMCQSSP